jgi:hypothetical protein
MQKKCEIKGTWMKILDTLDFLKKLKIKIENKKW